MDVFLERCREAIDEDNWRITGDFWWSIGASIWDGRSSENDCATLGMMTTTFGVNMKSVIGV